MCNNVIWNINADKEGYLWLSTDQGLSRFDPIQETFENYFASDGLQSSQFNHNAFFKKSNGEFIFGGNNGINIFDNASIKKDSSFPKLVLTALKILNTEIIPSIKYNNRIVLEKEIYCTHEIELHSSDRVVSIDFAALHFSNPNKNKYSYILEGFDEDWNFATADKRVATYTNLEPGTYNFRVRGSNSDGIWSPHEASLRIVMVPPFWKTWWFRLIMIIVGMAALMGFYFYRVNTIKAQNRLLKALVSKRTFEIEKQKNDLIALNATKDKFFSIISHDLKNPFQAITTLTTLLIDQFKEYSDLQKLQFLNQINNSSQKAFALLQNLLHWAQTQTDAIQYQPKDIQLNDIIEQAIMVYDVISSKKQISIVRNIPSNIYVLADENMLSTVLRNLISNAIKFTPENGTIVINANSNFDKTTIEVTDTGIGIKDELIEELFKIDKTFSTKGTAGETGSGLGLIICKEFITKNGGTLHVKSNKKGSTFGFTLHTSQMQPAEIYPISTSLAPANEQSKDSSLQTDPKVLVIVEDSEEIRKSLIQYLHKNYTIYEAENGINGLELIVQHMPDLIISDVVMPEMGGFELCNKVKTNPEISHIPVILLTAQHEDKYVNEGLDNGADDYLIKPFKPSFLEARIRNLIKNREDIKKRFRTELTLQPKDIIISTLDGDFLQNIVEVIENNIDNSEFGVEDLAKEIGIGRTHFYNKLKQLTDLTPAEFIRMIRLKRAAQLIKNSKLSISEITFMVGFNDIKNFRKLFKAQFGTTPSEYHHTPK